MRRRNAFAALLGQAVRNAVLSELRGSAPARLGKQLELGAVLRRPLSCAGNGGREVHVQYSMQKSVSMSFERTLERVKEELGKEGFGVLTEIDVRETLRRKLDVDFRNYRILGACNPSFAYQALQVEERIGLLLPCNVVVQETVDGRVEAAAIDPAVSMETVANPRLKELAETVRAKLRNVIERL